MNWIDCLALSSLLFYAVASVAVAVGQLVNNKRAKRLALGLTLVGFFSHSLLLLFTFASPEWALTGRTAYLLPVAWCLVAAALGMWWKLRLEVLLLFIAPLAFLLVLTTLSLGNPAHTLPASLKGPLFIIHLVGVSTGIGLMAVAAAAALFFLWQARTLKSKKVGAGLHKDLPSLNTLDRINALATIIGFPLYSMGLFSGFIWGQTVWGSLVSMDPKELVSLTIWAIYGLLFHQRLVLGWQGRKPAIMVLCIFAASLFSLFVVNVFFSTHHSFGASL